MNLADPAILRQFLASQGLLPDKTLGQHFLCSQVVVNAIVQRLASVNGVLEIGPGLGVLTAPIANAVERVVAIEVDARMIRALRQSAPTAQAVQVDALKADLAELLEGLPAPRAIVSNLPYYITAPLVEHIARARANFSLAVLMMQREVAQRIVAPPRTGERGSISVYLQAVFEIDTVVQAPAEAFLPPPKVDSTVLSFVPRTGREFPNGFFEFVQTCFTQPRKTLVNNLMASRRLPREAAIGLVQTAGLAPLVRAQELTEAEWLRLYTAAVAA